MKYDHALEAVTIWQKKNPPLTCLCGGPLKVVHLNGKASLKCPTCGRTKAIPKKIIKLYVNTIVDSLK